MFNHDAEVFVIYYPHGCGGRFLQNTLCLDPGIMSVAIESSGPLGNKNLFDRLKDYLSTSVNAHIDNTGHLPRYIPEKMRWANRYVFCVHQAEFASATKFLNTCKNLKIIIITMSSTESLQLVDDRRKFLGKDIPDEKARATYCIQKGEQKFLDWFIENIQRELETTVDLVIDVADYWNPDIAIPTLNKYFAERNINCNNWEELYHIWLNNSIDVCKK